MRHAKNKQYIFDKRNELIWALRHQGYSFGDIGVMFNLDRSTIFEIVGKSPKDWQPKWIKVT